jgi:hypothetical protein
MEMNLRGEGEGGGVSDCVKLQEVGSGNVRAAKMLEWSCHGQWRFAVTLDAGSGN